MTTLNFKALLIKTSFVVFIRAIGIYLLITIPAMAAAPFVYLVSATYAISFGWIAALLFLFLFYFLQRIHAGVVFKNTCLYVAVAVAVVAAFQMMEVMRAENRIWQSGWCLLFPAAAVISGWISLAVSKRKIKGLFVPDDTNYYKVVINTESVKE